jgi:hypothetical protein
MPASKRRTSTILPRVAATETALAAERQRAGTRVYGRRAVLKQSCWSRPASSEPRRKRPTAHRCTQQVGAHRGTATQPGVHRGLHDRARGVARRRKGHVPARDILVAAARPRVHRRDVTTPLGPANVRVNAIRHRRRACLWRSHARRYRPPPRCRGRLRRMDLIMSGLAIRPSVREATPPECVRSDDQARHRHSNAEVTGPGIPAGRAG